MVVALIAVLFVASCNKSHYEDVDDRGYRVSIKYDASGGEFATSSKIMVDSYKIDNLPVNADGNKEIYLVDPASEEKGEAKVVVANVGFAFIGWYEEREPVLNEQGQQLDVYGGIAAETNKQPAYIYKKKWDFNNQTVTIDSSKEYTSGEAVKTLYAGWIREFEFCFYDKETGKPITDDAGTRDLIYKFNPLLESNELVVPYWNTETGEIEMGKFPKVKGKTFLTAYYDKEGTNEITTNTAIHPGTYDPETFITENTSINIYLEFKDGDWRKVSKPSQIANPSLCYELLNDIDYEGRAWAFAHAEFNGKIYGNGYTIKNVAILQNGPIEDELVEDYYGLFGRLGATAEIKNVTFDNITVLVNKGSTQEGVCIGVIAGEIDASAKLDGVTVTSSKLQLSQECYFKAKEINVGILCGSGYRDELNEMLTGLTVEIVPVTNALFYYDITYDIDSNGNNLNNLKYTIVVNTQ